MSPSRRGSPTVNHRVALGGAEQEGTLPGSGSGSAPQRPPACARQPEGLAGAAHPEMAPAERPGPPP
eukprot:11719810-Alexandrium_andersonii.AAC.1